MENTIYIVDDHKMLQNGLRFWFEQNSSWKITGAFESVQPCLEALSKQESIVFEKMLQGKSNEEISNELFISLHSVHNYVTYIYTLSDVHNRTEFLEKFGKK